MRWSNVLVIFRREVRDQLRDKRTLFMIFVLPVLLYPVLGIGVWQLSVGLLSQKQNKVVLIGAEYLPRTPRLLNENGNGFNPALFDTPEDAMRLVVQAEPALGPWSHAEFRRVAIRGGLADAVVIIPPDVRQKLEETQTSPIISYDSANERSQTTYLRVRDVLANWKEAIVSSRLKRDQKPPAYTEPIVPKPDDVAPREEAGGSVWAKLFPFLLVMMSLTGAFYPAVDLCAGEKERGTMETLLISPASRAEIVLGKFFTVMLASMATAILNLLSMGLTGAQLAHMLSAMASAHGKEAAVTLAPPTLQSAFWMLVLLVPLSVFFSAVCLALGVMAKSMKEGQYYMTPLYLIALPLVFLSLVPGVELDLFYSLVPITGVSLLLKALIQGEYDVARHYFVAVLMTTIVYGAAALRWAIDQFQREGVLFREAERFDLRIWVRHLLRDKEPTPTAGEALFCFVLMLTSAWFLFGFMKSSSPGAMAAGQIAFILTPPLAMGFLLTSSPKRTLRLTWPKGKYLALAVGLVLALNPVVSELRMVVEYLFPIPQPVREALNQLMGRLPNAWVALILMALVPAVCEETAFRGYILSGFERAYRTRSAIILSALLFGFLHVLLSLFQQLFNAVLLGLVLGLLAVRSRSLLPGIVFHLLNNSLVLLHAFPAAEVVGPDLAGWLARHHASSWLYRNPEQGLFQWPWLVAGALVAAALLALLARSRDPVPEPAPAPLAGALS